MFIMQMPVVDIRPVPMSVGYFIVGMAMAMLRSDTLFCNSRRMCMHMVKIIMTMAMFMYEGMMGMDMNMFFGEQEDNACCHYRERNEKQCGKLT